MQKINAKELVDKFRAGNCTPEEIALLETWYLKLNTEKPSGLTEQQLLNARDEMWMVLAKKQSRQVRLNTVTRIAAAAAVILILGAGVFFYKNGMSIFKTELVKIHDVAPGGNKATLTLADGSSINLSDAANGALASQAGVAITKTADGKLIYNVVANSSDITAENVKTRLNTISTPVGGQYQINLPDGTRVWLNAASSIKFPAVFKDLKERRVEIKGEVYFEVAHNNKQPFVVIAGKQELSVLGTHFNVNSYTDEGAIRTTLLQGTVLVRNLQAKEPHEGKDFVVLKPGQQSSLTETMKVETVDTEMLTAWKDGNFMFTDMDLKSILKQIARWYNVDVEYVNVPEKRFDGFISRDVNLSKVLDMLEVTGSIKFKIEGKTIKIIN
jgi:transmembrane sensor